MFKDALKTLYKYWMIFAKKIAIIPTTIILFIIYSGAIGIVGIINFIGRKDILDKNLNKEATSWRDKEVIPVDFERCKRQF